ncbi:MAG: ATP-dependent RecD-like DNA helicase, partial [Holophagales bacterium]|nr:ATP-dependent RecD-like DNA helicase [Holophagales bacterium]
IEGVVEHVVFANEETGWTVIRLAVRASGTITAVGHLVGAQPGETLRLEGRWVKDPRYGKQLEVARFETSKPSTYLGIERYLASGLVEGIGPAMARRLVKTFGLETLDIIDGQPERLREVPGIGKVRSRRIRQAWKRQHHVRELMVFLQGPGVSATHAAKIPERYGEEAMAVVSATPHRLARDIFGIGFLTADRIARDLGLSPDSPERAAAGLLHVLEEAAAKGHLYLGERELIHSTVELLELPDSIPRHTLSELVGDGELVRLPLPESARGRASERMEGEDREADQNVIYLARLERAEAAVAERLLALTAQGRLPFGKRGFDIDVKRALAWVERRSRIRLAAKQRQALSRALTSKVMVLTGGPGTGKTTLVKGIVDVLDRKGLRIELAAPTGRAAKRLAESTGREAQTLHRLLEYQPASHGFTRGLELPLSADLVVVDETSMLDIALTRSLLEALRPDARLLLVGDVDQLPSIGPGRVLADLIDSEAVPVARLDEIFRQGKESLIVTNAHRVRDGLMPISGPPVGSRRPSGGRRGRPEGPSDFFFIERREPTQILDTLKQLVLERIPGHLQLEPSEEIQILTPMQKGLLGAANLNAELQAALNPEGEEVRRGGHLLRVGDRVMQRRNNYDLGVWNGDVGRVRGFDLQEQRASVEIDERIVIYPFTSLGELSLAYACSIHKSQGSEYPCVVIPLHTQHFALLQRNLLYTAITRGRQLVVLVGSRRALDIATHRQGSARRNTLLAERLRREL